MSTDALIPLSVALIAVMIVTYVKDAIIRRRPADDDGEDEE